MNPRHLGQCAALTKFAAGLLPRAFMGGLGGAALGAGIGGITADTGDRARRMRQGALIGGGLGVGLGELGPEVLKTLSRRSATGAAAPKNPAYKDLMARLESAAPEFEQQALGYSVSGEALHQGIPRSIREQLAKEHGNILASPNLNLGKLTDADYAVFSDVARDYLKRRGHAMAAHESPLRALEGNLRVGAEDRARQLVKDVT